MNMIWDQKRLIKNEKIKIEDLRTILVNNKHLIGVGRT